RHCFLHSSGVLLCQWVLQRGLWHGRGALWGPEGAKRMISKTPNAVLGKKPALARARQEEASVTDFHASMDVRLDAHSDRPGSVGPRESAMHDRAILITPLEEQLPRPCHKPLS